MKDYTIKRVSISDKNKEGKPLISKNGKPFYKVGIQVAEYGESWINGLWFDGACPWKENDVVKLIIAEELYNGKKQLKFELPRKENPNQKYFEEITGRLLKIEMMLIKIGRYLIPPEKDDYPPLTEENIPTF